MRATTSVAQEQAKTRRAIGWVLLALVGLFAFGWILTHWPGGEKSELQEGAGTVAIQSGDLTGLAGVDPASRALVQAAMEQKRLPVPDFLEELSKRPESGSPLKATITLRQPVGTAVMDQQPTFRWLTVPGDWIYTVGVDDGKGNVLATGDSQRPGQWQSDTDLPVNQTLRWQVTARDATGNSISSGPLALFRVVDPGTRAHLVTLRQQHAELHALLAVEFAKAGLVPEAQTELALLTAKNSTSPLLFKWSASLKGTAPAAK